MLEADHNNDYKWKKIEKPRLTEEGLNGHVWSLSSILSQLWFSRVKFSLLHDKVEKLVEAMHLDFFSMWQLSKKWMALPTCSSILFNGISLG